MYSRMASTLVRIYDTAATVTTRARRARESGLTLVELIVVVAIMVIVSSLILANNTQFGGKVLLQNLAYDVALTIRQAQVYGISVQRFSTDTFARAYGVHFLQNAQGVQGQFALFADVIGSNGLYDCTTPGNPLTCELVNVYAMRTGYRISDICVPKTQVRPCNHTRLDVTYQRPDPDAYIRADGVSTLYESARLYLAAPQGYELSVIIEENGQIAVE